MKDERIYKIALIKVFDNYSNDYDFTRVVTEVSDWEEITESDLQLLRRHLASYDYQIIVQPDDQSLIIKRGVAQALEEAKRLEAARKKADAERKERAEARKAKAKARQEEKEKKLLEDLLSKHGYAHGPLTDSK